MTEQTTNEDPLASTSGKNVFTIACQARGQRMNYAACLNRLASCDAGDEPPDWTECGKARRRGECRAALMRKEELAVGRSLFYVLREALEGTVASARKWIDSFSSRADRKAARAAGAGKSMFDAMGDAGTYADAISGGATAAPKPATVPKGPPAKALPGETPIQMARRIAAERNASHN